MITSSGRNSRVLRWFTIKLISTDEHFFRIEIFWITDWCKKKRISFLKAGCRSSRNLSRSCWTSGVSWIYYKYFKTLSYISVGSFNVLIVDDTISSYSWKNDSFLFIIAINAAIFPKINEVTKAPKIITLAEKKVYPDVIGEISLPRTRRIEL